MSIAWTQAAGVFATLSSGFGVPADRPSPGANVLGPALAPQPSMQRLPSDGRRAAGEMGIGRKGVLANPGARDGRAAARAEAETPFPLSLRTFLLLPPDVVDAGARSQISACRNRRSKAGQGSPSRRSRSRRTHKSGPPAAARWCGATEVSLQASRMLAVTCAGGADIEQERRPPNSNRRPLPEGRTARG